MSCHNCQNQNCNGCQGCGSCGECDQCNDHDNYCVCLGRQIEQLAVRDDQLKTQIELLNTGVPFEPLCEVQTCDSPDCANTGAMCDNQSPTGRPVGSGQGDSCCGQANPANLGDFCDVLAAKLRKIDNRLTKAERQIQEFRDEAVSCILLDAQGNVRGWTTINGDIKNANPGTWELATQA